LMDWHGGAFGNWRDEADTGIKSEVFGFIGTNRGGQQMLFHQIEPDFGSLVDLLEVGKEMNAAVIARLFRDEFAVADDVVYGGAKFVTELMSIELERGEGFLIEVMGNEGH
jgi:hypothetical protein